MRFLKGIDAQTASKINYQLELVLSGAQAPGQAVSAITEMLGEESRDRAIIIVRTNLACVHAVAAQQRMEQAAQHVPGMSKMWRKSGNIHSCANHDAIDGQVQPVGKPFELIGKNGKPLLMMHPHDPNAPDAEVIDCGCVALPHMESWAAHP